MEPGCLFGRKARLLQYGAARGLVDAAQLDLLGPGRSQDAELRLVRPRGRVVELEGAVLADEGAGGAGEPISVAGALLLVENDRTLALLRRLGRGGRLGKRCIGGRGRLGRPQDRPDHRGLGEDLVERIVTTLEHEGEIGRPNPFGRLVETRLGDVEDVDLAAGRPQGSHVERIGRTGRRLAVEEPGDAQEVLARTNGWVGAVTGRDVADELLGRIDGEAARVVGRIGRRPQEMAFLVVPPAVALAEMAARRLDHQVGRGQQAVGHVLGEPGDPGRATPIHVHPDGADGGHVGPPTAERGLSGVGLRKLAQGIHAEVDVAVMRLDLVEQATGDAAGGRAGRRVQAAELPEDAAARTVLRKQLLVGAVIVVHADAAARGPDLPGQTDDVARPEERLDEPQGVTLETELAVGLQQGDDRTTCAGLTGRR